ncbi:hypothetical protein BCF55_0551 [Hydrogenivirga caldilitoris]|uniref:Uncharacterized protein n=1 Tax=Hydrogenivirga caldilitoris TaxID=246264 RepID=A0A497XTN4_9AQUI|nr:hypothetical protein [Hydrogenivirga caldilitoris]RLJ70283.1 hypothetical protein BCF55_0551 [Hydrogenivirga caldilitoris]
METVSLIRTPKLYIAPELLDRARKEGRYLVLYPTLKFSCLIAKRFRAELSEEQPEEGIEVDVGNAQVYIVFSVVGSRFCGGEKGFEEMDFPVKEPERFLPKWIKVNPDMSGEFGYV